MPMGKRSTLAAAADRLDRMVQDIKRQQYEATGLRRIPLAPKNSPAPQDDWTRRSLWVLKPQREQAKLTDLTGFALPLAGRPKKPSFATAQALDRKPAADEKRVSKGGHIGSLLGKPGPRRGLLSRLFRRDN